MNATDSLGWLASGCLFLTLFVQIVRQWRSRSVEGVSPWLFVGQGIASGIFVAYSILVRSTVFVVTNVALTLAAIVGFVIWVRARNAGDEDRSTDDDRDTLPIPLASPAFATSWVEPGPNGQGPRAVPGPVEAQRADRAVDLVVSQRDTIGVDPIHRVDDPTG